MTELIINLLASVVIALLFAIYVIVTAYRYENKTLKERCDELEQKNKILRNGYNEVIGKCLELRESFVNMKKTAEELAQALNEK